MPWGFLVFSGGVSEVDAVEDCEDTDSLLPKEASSGVRQTFSVGGDAVAVAERETARGRKKRKKERESED